ncbi:MAG TPA: helix-turn-helix domain-containing protein [Solirubrobacterales bacterium]|nr:helix-turn-helix domain-containing protein [Solirubrobacterales bacterium]
MRKDAARSRRAILDAARELYADDVTASFAEIAHRAGVGQATVYRHFADRHALLAELAVEDMDRLEERVEAEPVGPDSLEGLLRDLLAEQVRSQGLIGAIRAGEVDEGRVRELADRCRELFRPRLEAARAAGVVRPDLTVDDLMIVLSMIGGALAAGERARRAEAARRAFEMVIDGLRSRA